MVFYDERQIRKHLVRCLLAVVVLAYLLSAIVVFAAIHSHDGPTIGPFTASIDQYDGTAIALTFDDGPDPKYTSRILAILKEKQVHATFFFVGKQMLHHPGLVREVHQAGHEIGNHSFTHSEDVHADPTRIKYELQTTNEIIAVLTGRPARFYRSPYLLDFGQAKDEFLDPRTFPEGHPVDTIDELGYISVSAYIDPHDWEIQHAGRLLHNVIDRVENGSVLLLHDGGPQREATVEALPHIIDQLRAQGFSFVRLSDLAGLPPNDSLTFTTAAHTSGTSLLTSTYRVAQQTFLVAIIFVLAVSILRLVAVLYFRLSSPPEKPVRYAGGVSVLIPAYNEEANISGTIESIARSSHETIEIIVINDGSNDRTGAICEEVQKSAGRPLRYLYQHNGGKAKALNLGLANATYDTVVAVDGDTILHPDAISYLASNFLDPRVGAVAGKVTAVHDNSWLGMFQDMEYLVSQNVEKTAFNTLFGSIAVIPGAIGAWRRHTAVAAGGYSNDTSVEDQDLTLAIHELGLRIVYDDRAIAYTEVPLNLGNFLKQRFRWVYGSIQCLWKYKHRLGSTSRYQLGCIILPYGILFSLITPLLMPFIDMVVLYALLSGSWTTLGIGALLFLGIDVLYHVVGFATERRKFRYLPLVPLQRVFYRLVMSYLIYKTLLTALEGHRVGWGAQLRAGTAAAWYHHHLSPNTVRVPQQAKV